MDQSIKDLCIKTLEFSLIIEIKITEDNKIPLHSWLSIDVNDSKNFELCKKDFNNKLKLLSILLNKPKHETLAYLKSKLRTTYG